MSEQKKKWSPAIWMLLLASLNTGELFAEDAVEESFFALGSKPTKELTDEKGYTINFNNVSITEYIRFVSKIFNVNFVFEDTDLQFNVTIVSEDPVSSRDVMSALVQVLRAHNLVILEQNNNLLITKSPEVQQLATVVTDDSPGNVSLRSALVTRVFRIKNANLGTLATILKPMMSKDALIEASLETRQLIVTDISTNVEKIATLLTSLDAPHSPLDISTYYAKNLPLQQLIAMSSQIVSPFAESNPLILVPQPSANAIYIVSTPFLIEKTLAVLADLDGTAKGAPGVSAMTNVFVYKAVNKEPADLKKSLTQIADVLKDQKNPPTKLIDALRQARVIKDSHSLLFIADSDTTAKIKDLLENLDTTSAPALKNTFYIYQVQNADEDQIENSLKQIADHLKSSENPDYDLIAALGTMKWVKETHSLTFTGDEKSLKKIQDLMPLVDVAPGGGKVAPTPAGPTQFLIYKPKNKTGPQIMHSLQEVAKNLKETGYADPVLLQTLNSIKWTESTESLIFVGDTKALEEIQELLKIIDSSAGATAEEEKLSEERGFYLYMLKKASGDTVLAQLQKIAENLKNSNAPNADKLANTLKNIKWVKETNTLVITGDQASIEYAKQLIAGIDSGGKLPTGMPGETGRAPTDFVLYSPQYVSGPDLISVLQDFETNLKQASVSAPGLYETIDNLKWIEMTCSLLISGDQDSIAKVEELLLKFDIPKASEGIAPTIGVAENANFLVYKLQYHQGAEIQNALKQIAADLTKTATGTSKTLMEAVNSIQWITVTNSLLATGEQDTLTKLKTLIENLDVPLRQVFIEVLVIETDLDNSQNFGLQWGGKLQWKNRFGSSFNNIPETPAGTINNLLPALGTISATKFPNAVTDLPVGSSAASLPGFDLGVIGDIVMHKGKAFLSLGSLINAIQQDADATIIMNPKIITQDNNNSTIFVGQNIPFSSSVVTTTGPNTTQTVNVEYRDVGVNLSITPILGNGNIITLNISNDITEQTQSQLQALGATITGLQTTHTNMNTRVHVPDRHFLVLSGMIQESTTHYKSSIPCLGGLPLIGAAFGTSQRDRAKKNIIIFVRPQIVNSVADYDAITEHQEQLHEQEAFLPSVQDAYQGGIDLVKPVVPE